MKKFFLLFFLPIFLFCKEENIATQDDNIIPVNENLIYLRYEDLPKRVYVGQPFEIKIKAIIAVKKIKKIETNFRDLKDIKVLNKDNSWKLVNNIYYNTYYLKATSNKAVLPTIEVSIYENKTKVASHKLPKATIEIIKLNGDKYFSGVVANNLKVIKSKATRYDDRSNILVLQIEGVKANLRDFNIKDTIKNGIDSYKGIFPNNRIFYFAILPKTQRKFIFSYFNVLKNKYVKFQIPVVVKNEDISTQLELNPKESEINRYKNIALMVVAGLSFVLFIFRRKIVYILIFIGVGVYLYMFYNPLESIILEKGTKIRILPTYNSTIFYITTKKVKVQQLDKVKNYTKVLLENGKIGWIQDKESAK